MGKRTLLEPPNTIIKNLELEDVGIHVTDRFAETPVDYDIAIDRFEAEPLRSHFAVFDLLFRSNLNGTLNGAGIEIINTKSDGQRRTRWTARDVSAGVLASLIGGPFSLFESGTVDVEVSDHWEAERVEDLHLDWAPLEPCRHAAPAPPPSVSHATGRQSFVGQRHADERRPDSHDMWVVYNRGVAPLAGKASPY